MKQSLTEVVDTILERMQSNPEAPPSESGIRSWMARQGYNKRDIDAAIKQVRPRFDALPCAEDRRLKSVRLLSALEEYKLSAEAREALARLELYGLLGPADREMILDNLNRIEGEVGLEELDYLLSWAVVSGCDVESQQTFYSVFDGNRETLH